MITRLDDPHSDKVNISQFRHFARDHQRSHTLPGMIEIDLLNVTPKPHTAMDVAVGCVVMEHDPDGIKAANRIYKNAPLVADPVRMLVAQASMPAPEPDPVPASIEKLEALINSQPQKTMPKTTTLKAVTTPAPQADKPARKSPKTIDRIGQVEFFKLCTTLNEIDMIGIDSLPKLADKLSKAYGRKVGPSTAGDALVATGRKLDKVQVEVTDAQAVIARTLTALLIKLSEPVPEELRRLCGEIE
jgi:hypothetical protein